MYEALLEDSNMFQIFPQAFAQWDGSPVHAFVLGRMALDQSAAMKNC